MFNDETAKVIKAIVEQANKSQIDKERIDVVIEPRKIPGDKTVTPNSDGSK